MRRLCLVIMVGVLVPGLAARAEETHGTIRAVGRVTVWMALDEAECIIDITVSHPDPEMAQMQARQRMAKLLEAVEAAGIPGLQAQPKTYLSVPRFILAAQSPGSNGVGVFEVYSESHVWIAGLKQPDALCQAAQRVVAQAKQSGAQAYSRLSGDMGPAWREALEKATKLAMQDAQAMAHGLGVSVRGYRYVGVVPERASGVGQEGAESKPPVPFTSWYGEPRSMRFPDTADSGDGSLDGVAKLVATVYVTAVY